MPWPEFWIILGITAACNAVGRVLPLMALANRHMPERIQQALSLIPAAVFAALVTNDLFMPTAQSGSASALANLAPYLAALPVVLVSYKKRSLFLAILVGIACYSLLSYLA